MASIFSESEAINQKNKHNTHSKVRPITLDVFTPKSVIDIIRGHARKVHSHCKDCGDKLESKQTQIKGLCALCENK